MRKLTHKNSGSGRGAVLPALLFVLGVCWVLLAMAAGVSAGVIAVPSASLFSAAAPRVSSTVVISEFRTRGPSGAADEFIELYNLSSLTVNVGGWKISGSSSGGVVSTRLTISTGTTIQPYGHFLAANSGYSGTVAADQTYSTGIADDGGIGLLDPADNIIDQAGMSVGSAYKEGTTLAPVTQSANQSYERKPGGASGSTQDTDNNATDFQLISPSAPQNLSSVPAGSNTATTTSTSTVGSSTATGTATSTPSATYTPTVTRTPTITPTATRTPTPGAATPQIEIYMLSANGYAVGQTDEAVRLINVGAAAANLSGWLVSNGGGSISIPSGTSLAFGQKIWIANQAVSFRTYFGFNPDFEYGADSDPTVPQAVASLNFAFGDTSGTIQVKNSLGAVEDTLVYGTASTSAVGWSGAALQDYTNSGFAAAGQIYYRKLNQDTGLPVADTNTADDWAQDNNGNTYSDNIDGRKLLRPGWALTNPGYEDMFSTKVFTETGATTKYLVAPDNIYDPIRNLIISATTAISIETYEWRAAPLVTEIINAKNRGVNVSIAIDGNPTGGLDNDTLWSAQQWESAGIPVYFFSGTPNTTSDQYRYSNVHAKFMIVDNQWLATGSENFSLNSMPNDNKANGTKGNRGAMVITNAPNVVAYASRLYNFDVAPGGYADLVRYPGLGTPPPGYSPTPYSDYTAYMPIKPTPLVVTENSTFQIVQSPDNSLRDHDSLIGLVNGAGAGDLVMVEQLYERKYWQTSTSVGPNPRLQAYIDAAQRGADVRILLDGDTDDCAATHNSAVVDYVNGLGLANLRARIGTPTSDTIHNKMVLVSRAGTGTVHISSINGSEQSSKSNRELGLQITSNAAYNYYKDVFEFDWGRGYIGNCFLTATPTSTATLTPGAGLTSTATSTATPTPSPSVTPSFTVTPSPTATSTVTPTATPLPATSHVVISEFRTQGPSGAADEFVELYNPTDLPVDISGWKIRASNNAASTGDRITVAAGTILPAHGHFLATNTQSTAGVAGDQTYATGITNDGGVAVVDNLGAVVDQVGMSTGSAYGEGTRLTALGTNENRSYERKPGGASGSTQDTNSNANDFQITAPSDPQNLSSAPVPALPTATATATGVSTPSPTATLTATISPTPTITASPTATNTPTFTLTAVPTSTNTATSTASPTSTNTATYTPTPTATSTPTFTITATPTSTATSSPTLTATQTPTPTYSPTASPTATGTPTPSATPSGGSTLVCHVLWQGRPQQPSPAQALPLTVTLKLDAGSPLTYAGTTDSSGYITFTLGSVPTGTYSWRAKGPQFLASGGTLAVASGTNSAELGLLKTGDVNDDNCVGLSDFNILKIAFGTASGNNGYDGRADLNGDDTVSITDFNLMKLNYGQCGVAPLLH